MSCENKVSQFVPRGWDYKEIKSSCGTTGIHGEVLFCDSCMEKLKKKYPQGWNSTPGDICPHGAYVGDPYGPDYICGQCEMGE